MSGRESDPKRQRSRSDREPSPKRSRRDGKPEAERVVSKKDLETDKKPPQSLRDAAPLQPDTHALSQDGEKKHSGNHETDKQAPRSRPYHQHDDLRSFGRGDRRATSERGSWRGSRDEINRNDEKSRHRKDEDRRLSHESEGALSRKRPAFREKKIPEESGNKTDRRRSEEEARDTSLNNGRQNERNWRSNMHSERPGTGRDRVWKRDDERGRQSYRADRGGFSRTGSWTRDEKKWDHDLFEEANKSPGRASEEEQIAKVEALLAS